MSSLDSRIEKEIKEAIDKEMRESALDINVAAKNSLVKLSGFVDTLGEKKAAEEIVTTIKGVVGVENNITLSTDGTVSDKDIEELVINKFKDSEFKDRIGRVDISVTKGVAVLGGSVETLRDKKIAISEAQKALGVKDVVSNTDIASEGQFDDVSIANKLTQRFSETELSIPDIVTDVKRGTVHIFGHVNNRNELELASQIAEEVEGVVKVHNSLELR